MQLGGWWRLWIGLSGLWVAAALGVAFFKMERPSPSTIAKEVGDWCGLDMPVPPHLAKRVLKVPSQLATLSSLDGNANSAARRPVELAVRSTVGAVVAHAGKADTHRVTLVRDPEGKKHIAVSPAHFTDQQVFEQVDNDRHSRNSWSKYQDYCIGLLQSQGRNELYPRKSKEWVSSVASGTLSFPIVTLLLGAFIGWVWRGFHAAKDQGSNDGLGR